MRNSHIQSIIFPSSFAAVTGAMFRGSKVRSVSSANPCPPFRQQGDWLLDESGKCMIRYLGSDKTPVLPATIEVVGKSAFQSNATIAHFLTSMLPCLKRIESDAFYSATLERVNLPDSVQFVHGSAFSRCHIVSFTVCDTNCYLRVFARSFLLDCKGTRLITYFGSDSDLVIPARVQTLGEACFQRNTDVLTVRFAPSSELAVIEDSAFAFAEIHSITLPSSFTALSGSIFLNTATQCVCFSDEETDFRQVGPFLVDNARLIRYLGPNKDVIIPATIDVIGESAFALMETVSRVTFAPKSGLKTIESNTFAGSSLVSISLPDSVKFIDPSAFTGCSLDSATVFRISEVMQAQRRPTHSTNVKSSAP